MDLTRAEEDRFLSHFNESSGQFNFTLCSAIRGGQNSCIGTRHYYFCARIKDELKAQGYRPDLYSFTDCMCPCLAFGIEPVEDFTALIVKRI